MPISVIGKRGAGFTLIEVLAVLALVGLLSALVFPEFLRWQERIEMNLIKTLIQSDLNHLREEALAEHRSGVLSFKQDGYDFGIGDRDIQRRFARFKLVLDDESTGSGDLNTSTSEEPQEDGAVETEVRFDPTGKCELERFQWETSHYRGEIRVAEDGTVEWIYVPK